MPWVVRCAVIMVDTRSAVGELHRVGLTQQHHAGLIQLWNSCDGISLREADSRERMETYLLRNPGLSFVAEVGKRIAKATASGNKRLTLELGGKQVALPVCGVFELNDEGKITGWRDYFDMAPLNPT